MSSKYWVHKIQRILGMIYTNKEICSGCRGNPYFSTYMSKRYNLTFKHLLSGNAYFDFAARSTSSTIHAPYIHLHLLTCCCWVFRFSRRCYCTALPSLPPNLGKLDMPPVPEEESCSPVGFFCLGRLNPSGHCIHTLCFWMFLFLYSPSQCF